MHGFQLWVNLPRSDKMISPRYQEISSSQIPKATSADGLLTVNVIAGEAMGQHSVIETRTPIEITAIGIGHDVTRYYRRAVTINDAEELGGTMMQNLIDLFDEKTSRQVAKRAA